MQRTMFSGASTPSAMAQSRKKRQGMSSLSHTMMRFQKPIIDSSMGEAPTHALASLIAFT